MAASSNMSCSNAKRSTKATHHQQQAAALKATKVYKKEQFMKYFCAERQGFFAETNASGRTFSNEAAHMESNPKRRFKRRNSKCPTLFLKVLTPSNLLEINRSTNEPEMDKSSSITSPMTYDNRSHTNKKSSTVISFLDEALETNCSSELHNHASRSAFSEQQLPQVVAALRLNKDQE